MPVRAVGRAPHRRSRTADSGAPSTIVTAAGQRDEARTQRVQAEYVLEDEAAHEQRAEHRRRGGHQYPERGAAPAAEPSTAGGNSGSGVRRSCRTKARADAARDQPDRAHRWPSSRASGTPTSVCTRARQGHREQRGAGQVEPRAGGLPRRRAPGRARPAPSAHDQRRYDIEEEHRPPAQLGDQRPADQRTGGGGHPDGAGPQRDGHPQPVGRDTRPAASRAWRAASSAPNTPWTTRSPITQPTPGREPDAGRGRAEPQHAPGEDALMPVPVAEPPREHQQPRHRDQIAGAGPLHLGERGVQIPPQGRLGDVSTVPSRATITAPSTLFARVRRRCARISVRSGRRRPRRGAVIALAPQVRVQRGAQQGCEVGGARGELEAAPAPQLGDAVQVRPAARPRRAGRPRRGGPVRPGPPAGRRSAGWRPAAPACRSPAGRDGTSARACPGGPARSPGRRAPASPICSRGLAVPSPTAAVARWPPAPRSPGARWRTAAPGGWGSSGAAPRATPPPAGRSPAGTAPATPSAVTSSTPDVDQPGPQPRVSARS